jgi:CRP-like cAMP-binding protein
LDSAIAFTPEPDVRAERASGLLLTESRSLALRQPDLLSVLSPSQREAIISRSRRRHYPVGTPIFAQGENHDGIFLIESGRVQVYYTSPSGREITLAYWNAGNFVGGPDIFGGGAHMWSGTAVMPTGVLVLHGPTLKQFAVDIPALALSIIEALSFKGRCYSTLAQILGTRSISERMLQLVLQLTELYGVGTAEGTRIDYPLSHSELAQMVGATRQWVTTTLNRLKAAGVLVHAAGIITVLDAAKLRRAVFRE